MFGRHSSTGILHGEGVFSGLDQARVSLPIGRVPLAMADVTRRGTEVRSSERHTVWRMLAWYEPPYDFSVARVLASHAHAISELTEVEHNSPQCRCTAGRSRWRAVRHVGQRAAAA